MAGPTATGCARCGALWMWMTAATPPSDTSFHLREPPCTATQPLSRVVPYVSEQLHSSAVPYIVRCDQEEACSRPETFLLRVCRYLAGQGRADPKRLCISGGSAGGYTTLAALAFKCACYGAL